MNHLAGHLEVVSTKKSCCMAIDPDDDPAPLATVSSLVSESNSRWIFDTLNTVLDVMGVVDDFMFTMVEPSELIVDTDSDDIECSHFGLDALKYSVAKLCSETVRLCLVVIETVFLTQFVAHNTSPPAADAGRLARFSHWAPVFPTVGSTTNSLSNFPLAASWSQTLPSKPAEAMVLPSGVQAAVYAGPLIFSQTTFVPVSVL